ncbi:LysR family transcriptional regulator [Halomonas sp. PAMB 3264]|uniref:LysR family transcriptional regulator n=1 Tax=Halomonas sp. PAMB 3264 TaxID=3075222 RepID=UPI0028989C94|nr:LysR family transcriptional regulator [Halomonas sp. PAMB 3264]WNL43255.1 LysR family transcriptional regulator [Halomonas sp. PAMB 3264]
MISGRALHYFDTVARCRSLRQAAAKLHIAPTAISRQIDLLEHQMGAPLLERGPNGISLTAAGELLAAQAQHTLRDLERVQEHIADLKGLRTGRVRLQVAEGVVAGLLAPALADMAARHPRLNFDIGIASAGQMVESLRLGTADIGLSFFMPRHEDILVLESVRLEHHAVMAPEHPLAAACEVTIEALAEHRIILPGETFGARQAFERSAHRAGIKLMPTFDTASLETQKALALNGAGVLILPPMAVARECRNGELKSIPLAPDELEPARMDLCVFRHRTRSFAVEACLSLLAKALQAHDSSPR